LAQRSTIAQFVSISQRRDIHTESKDVEMGVNLFEAAGSEIQL